LHEELKIKQVETLNLSQSMVYQQTQLKSKEDELRKGEAQNA
jgi:hypothetical protein